MKTFKVKYRPQFDSLYDKAVKEIVPESYLLIDPGSPLSKHLCPPITQNFLTAVLSTTSTINILKYQDITVPKGSQLVHQRFYRACDHDGNPHANVNDLLMFPTIEGRIGAVSRDDSPDHYMALMKMAGLQDLAGTYNLPKEKSGHINVFTAAGAVIPIVVDFKRDD